MKIGLFTIFQVPNYGSVLQAFATQCLLEKLGHECKIIDYLYPNNWHWNQGAPRPNRIKVYIRKFIPSRKNKVLEEFRKGYFHYTRRYKDLEDLTNENWSSYDAFAVGSDQVWNYRFLRGDKAFMLSFVPFDKPRFSIASSFAASSIPYIFQEKYKNELSKFRAISVRETNGIDIIQKQLGIDIPVEVILDPTLLLSKDEWLSLIPRSGFKKKRPYILFYMWAYAFEPRPYIFEVVKHFQKEMDCDVIALEGYTPADKAEGVIMQNASSSTLPEFIDLFANSDLVVTSSFHGTAFGLNFNRPLISIVPDNVGDDRQITLLKSVGAENCIANIGTNTTLINPILGPNVVNRLREIRLTNIGWIKSNIK